MAEPVLVDVGSEEEALDLSRALVVRGLAARRTTIDGRPEVELHCRREETQRLLADLLPALEAWRRDRAHGPLRVIVGGRVHVVGLEQVAEGASFDPPGAAAA
jgi:hypothetical protein